MIDKNALVRIGDIIPILEEYADLRGLEMRPTRKPTHGSCCTCQTCGWDNDECVCYHNEIIEWLEKLAKANA